MCRMIGSIRTLAQHFLTLNIAPSVYKPKRCPQCKHGVLWAHGVYYRQGDRSLISEKRSVSTPVPRFRCPHCNTTCSRLPGCLSPRRWYPWDAQAMALFLVFRGNSLALIRKLVVASEDTIRRWRAWLAEHAETFEFHLRSVFSHLGRNGQGEDFWYAALREKELSRMMATVCRLGEAVP